MKKSLREFIRIIVALMLLTGVGIIGSCMESGGEALNNFGKKFIKHSEDQKPTEASLLSCDAKTLVCGISVEGVWL